MYPETIPCTSDTADKKCGFNLQESYIESSSVQCRSRLCIVHRLDNKTQGKTPAESHQGVRRGEDREEQRLCDRGQEQRTRSSAPVACDLPLHQHRVLPVSDGFMCDEVLTLGRRRHPRRRYCVKPKATTQQGLLENSTWALQGRASGDEGEAFVAGHLEAAGLPDRGAQRRVGELEIDLVAKAGRSSRVRAVRTQPASRSWTRSRPSARPRLPAFGGSGAVRLGGRIRRGLPRFASTLLRSYSTASPPRLGYYESAF